MRRILEFAFYALFILFFIARYSDTDGGTPRRPAPSAPEDAAILLPEGAPLPRDVAPTVVVDIENVRQNSVGTAFAVDNGGLYVSARHVIEGCDALALVRGRALIEALVVAIPKNRDFAVLRAHEIDAARFPLSTEVPERGDDGFMMGFPQGKPADVHATAIGSTVMRSRGRYSTRERVVAWAERERRPAFSGSLGGISGGPVFARSGYIVGTVVAGAPRRGRVYTTNPSVFSQARLFEPESSGLPTRAVPLTPDTYADEANRYRASMRIAQVYCQVRP